MKVRILGAHLTEIASAKPTALVVDSILALDAGSLCSALTMDEQRKLRGVFITHYHYDHVRDLPLIGMNLAYRGCLNVYGTAATFDALSTHLLDGKLYPNFREWPESHPSLQFITLEGHARVAVEGYTVVALPVPHGVPSVGFQVISPEGRSLFFTGDTGGGLSSCWEHASPDLLITEMTWPRQMEAWAKRTTHLSPQLLRTELLEFRRLKGYVPRTVLVHLDPASESEVSAEVAEIAQELGVSITLGQEGMLVTV